MINFFKNLLSSDSKKNTARFSLPFTDIHSHLIPAIDDGAKDMEDALSLAKELYHLGFKKVITTPHIMADSYRNTPEIINSGLQKLRVELKNAGIPIEINAAAEYYLDEYFEKLVDQKKLLTFGENYLLFEISFAMKPSSFEGIVFKMNSNGYQPILAHPERYMYLHERKLTEYKKIKDLGVLFQLNLSSLTLAYSAQVRSITHLLIDEKMIDFVGTDLHNLRQLGYIKEAIKEKYFQKLANCPLRNNNL